MADTYDFSQNFDITLYGPDKLARVMRDDWLVGLAPPSATEYNRVEWEMQENGYGLLSLRGPNGQPKVTNVAGYRRMGMDPGYYGEKVIITEKEMNESREYGTANDPMNIEKRIGYIQESILKRAFDQMRVINSSWARTGAFLITNDDGSITHSDTLEGYSSRNVFTPAISWGTSPSTAKPLDDLQLWQSQLQLGTDSVFDENSEIAAATPTINYILQTAQIRSQIKLDYGNTAVGLPKLNDILNAAGLPKIVRYDEDYYSTKALATARTGATRFIPTGSLIWKGKRKDGALAAQFQLTRSATKNPPAGIAQNASGSEWSLPGGMPMAEEFRKALYTIIQYRLVPAQYEVDIGFNGGPAVIYPSAFAGISFTVPS